MPIVRTYGCDRCGHFTEVTLTFAQADDPPPDCPHCAVATVQEFKPLAIVGSIKARAADLAQTIAHEDYHATDIEVDYRQESVPKVRFKDQTSSAPPSVWTGGNAMLAQALAFGRQARMQSGGESPIESLKRSIANGSQPDLIEVSKRRAMRIWQVTILAASSDMIHSFLLSQGS